jgi:hypothetical protein
MGGGTRARGNGLYDDTNGKIDHWRLAEKKLPLKTIAPLE